MRVHSQGRRIGAIRGVQADLRLPTTANKLPKGGGGLCGAIHKAAGLELFAAYKLLCVCRTGQVRAKPGFHLTARYIIHAVEPYQDEEPALLASCYRNALELAASMSLRSIAFPCISTGIYGLDAAQVADIALGAVCECLGQGTNMARMDSMIFAFHRIHRMSRSAKSLLAKYSDQIV